ncbi:TPA: NAD-dependent protein deacetylase [Clostridium sporogenes]
MESKQYEENIATVLQKIKEAEVIIVGGASGISTANGHDFYNNSKYWRDNFSEFEKNYGIRGNFEALYYRYQTSEERWAYLAKHCTLMFDTPPGQTYIDLHKIIKDKEHFIITTNQDMQFSKLFSEEKICLPQGDAHYLQCAKPCHDQVYPAEEIVRNIAANIQDTRIPKELIPRCPVCGGEMEPWIRSYVFLEGSFWKESFRKYKTFLAQNANKKVVFIELGVGPMTPNIIKYPFNQMAYRWPQAYLVRINKGEEPTPRELEDKILTLDQDIGQVLRDLASQM